MTARIAPIIDWQNPQDGTVQTALALKCGMSDCGAKPGEHCRSFDGGPLPSGRIVHHFRLDKAFKADKEES